MKDNQYFIDLRTKFDIMEKYVSDIKNMVTQIRTSLNELSLDLQNGRVTTIEEAKRRVDSIRMFGTEIPPKGCEDAIDADKEKSEEIKYNNPLLVCKLDDNSRIIAVEVGVQYDNPIAENMRTEKITGMAPILSWLIKHMVNVDVLLRNDFINKRNIYRDAKLINIYKDPSVPEEDICVNFGYYNNKTSEIQFDFDVKMRV